jgi:hypothetical protein
LKNIEIKRKQTKYKNKIITKRQKRQQTKPNTKQIQQTHHRLFLLGVIWFGLSSPYGLKNLQIERKQMKYKKEHITPRKQKKANNLQKENKKNKQNNIS